MDINNGNLLLENGTSLKMCRSGNTGCNVVNQAGGKVTFYSDAGMTVGGGGNLDLNYAGSSPSSSTYNLKAGTLTVPQIIASSGAGSSTFNFNGGTLKPTANSTAFMQGLTAANVRNGGAVIDTTGFKVTIGQPLLHSAIAGDSATDGGLTKNCIGTLTLSGTNYYTGNTTINAGILELAQSVPTLATNSTISIAGGAVLQLDQSAVTNRVAGLLTNGVVAGKGLYRSANSSGFITGPGYLQVLTGPNGPGIIAHSIRGNTLTLTWPAGQGWRLQMETNLASPGWVYLTDGSTSSTNITVDPTLPGEYFRLVFS